MPHSGIGSGASMHELSVAVEICRMAEERLGIDAPRLAAVGVAVGEASGLESENLSFCLDALLAQPPFGRARAVIVRTNDDALRLDYLEVDDDDRPND